MNKVIFGIIAAVVVILAGGVFLSTSSDEEADQASGSNVATSNSSSDQDSVIELESTGSSEIMEYSPEALAASETEANLLFFHAEWCSVCKSVERNIEAGSIPDSLSIFQVDYDSDVGQQLARDYSIGPQYTMVQVNPEGEEVTQWVNNYSDGINDIVANLQ